MSSPPNTGILLYGQRAAFCLLRPLTFLRPLPSFERTPTPLFAVSDSTSYFQAHIELAPTPSQQEALDATLHAFAAACDYAVDVGHTTSTTSNMVLHQRCYHDIRRIYRLSANLAVRSIARAARRLKGHAALPDALRETIHYSRAATGQSPLPLGALNESESDESRLHAPSLENAEANAEEEAEEEAADLQTAEYDARTLSIPSRRGVSLSTVAGRMREVNTTAANRPLPGLVDQAIYRAALLRCIRSCTKTRYHVIIEFAQP